MTSLAGARSSASELPLLPVQRLQLKCQPLEVGFWRNGSIYAFSTSSMWHYLALFVPLSQIWEMVSWMTASNLPAVSSSQPWTPHDFSTSTSVTQTLFCTLETSAMQMAIPLWWVVLFLAQLSSWFYKQHSSLNFWHGRVVNMEWKAQYMVKLNVGTYNYSDTQNGSKDNAFLGRCNFSLLLHCHESVSFFNPCMCIKSFMGLFSLLAVGRVLWPGSVSGCLCAIHGLHREPWERLPQLIVGEPLQSSLSVFPVLTA